jgi:two-component system, NarL family, sensor histidine kinase BarA
MSYRTIKRLLGETSLERKCRFLFGGGLMLLITLSFLLYARLNANIVYKQNETSARLLIAPIIMEKHWKAGAMSPDAADPIAASGLEFDPEDLREFKPEDLRKYSWDLFSADPADPVASKRPSDAAGQEALAKLRQGDTEHIRINKDQRDQGEYQYYGPVRAAQSCIACHYHQADGVQEGELIGMVKISFPLDRTERDLAWNNAILLATAIVTAFLAMLAAYAIVRYVIVKPVLHLKDVSDTIARGNLDLRADIRTGDEFEELSHAFNRMLRHLVTVQEELRQVNTDLDAKVDELAQVNLRLYETNNLKNEFLATMSHELRTPLNSILGFSEVLTGSPGLTEKQRRYVQNIQTSGKSLLALINDVLDLAKIESGKMELHIVEFSMRELVERLVGSMMPLAEKKNIDLTSQIDPRLPLLMQDSGKLQQILNNLLSNAVKFTPEGGRVRTRVELYDEKTLDLIVEDTGIGIPLEEQATIFEKFRQGKTIPGQRNALTRQYEGTGLGLSIVKELSKLLGGEVLLESEFGKGSTFTVRVPIDLQDEADRLEEEAYRRPAGQLLLPAPDGLVGQTANRDNNGES